MSYLSIPLALYLIHYKNNEPKIQSCSYATCFKVCHNALLSTLTVLKWYVVEVDRLVADVFDDDVVFLGLLGGFGFVRSGRLVG